jgi:hypothetical protein
MYHEMHRSFLSCVYHSQRKYEQLRHPDVFHAYCTRRKSDLLKIVHLLTDYRDEAWRYRTDYGEELLNRVSVSTPVSVLPSVNVGSFKY